MKIRLHGTVEECSRAAERLCQVLDVVSISEPYPDRGRSVLVRVYVEARLPQGDARSQPSAPRAAPPSRRSLPRGHDGGAP